MLFTHNDLNELPLMRATTETTTVLQISRITVYVITFFS